MQLSSIRFKMLVVVLIAAALGFAATVTLVVVRASDLQTRTAFALVDEAAQKSSSEAQVHLERAIDTARALANALQGLQRTGLASREAANAILRQVMNDQQDLIGVWTAWEPNAFDGRDADYRGRRDMITAAVSSRTGTAAAAKFEWSS